MGVIKGDPRSLDYSSDVPECLVVLSWKKCS